MYKQGDGKERLPIRVTFFFIFCTCVLPVFLTLVCPVSALLNGTETVVTTDVYKTLDYPPALSGDRIAWSTQDINDDPASGYSSRYIIITNLTSGDQYAVPSPMTSWNSAPSMEKNTLVWMQDPDGMNFNIIAYDLAANTQLAAITVTPGDYYSNPKNNVFPKISGTSIVWQDYSHGDWDIFYYDLTWAPQTPQEQIIIGSGDQKNPAIYENYIVYENWSGLISSIYLYNITNSTSSRISTSDNEVTPAIYGAHVVWQNISATNNKRIILYNIITGETRQISPEDSPFDRTHPEISGNYIVWEDTRERNPYTDIYLYDLTDGSERWLTPCSPGGKNMPAVNGNRIVWEDARATHSGGYDNDIYLLTLGAPETCPSADFTADNPVNPPGGIITFSDSSSPGTSPIAYRLWNFSDGSAWENDPAPVTTHSHIFSQGGNFGVRLTVGNAKCRNISPDDPGHIIFINSPPVADFTAVPLEGVAPLMVTFTDSSFGAPTFLSWDFGDGSPLITGSSVVHTFTESNKDYQVTLTATNEYGPSTATKTIRTYMGDQSSAKIPIPGISVDNRFGRQFLTYDAALLPEFSPDPPERYLISYPPKDYGWQNITFLTSDTTGIQKDPAGNTFYANVSRFYFTSGDTLATTDGSIPRIGNNWGVSYQINTTVYPSAGSLQTIIREGASDRDRSVFDDIAARAWPSGTLVRDIAYTATINHQNFRAESSAIINMSVAEDWVKGPSSSVFEGREYTYILGYGYDKKGNKQGAILTKRFIANNNGLEYYEADVPESASYLSTFSLVKLSGSGNLFQILTLTIVTHLGGSGEGGGGEKVVVQATPAPKITHVAPPDPGKTVKLYSNAQGVITQKTTLKSTDGLATVTILEGVIAKNTTGYPLSSLGITAISPDTIPGMSADSAFNPFGMAYDLQPDNSSFSPSVFLNFTVPQARWDQNYMVKTYDRRNSTWLDLPTSYDPDTGVVTARISHLCCFALFTKTITPEHSGPVTRLPTPIPSVVISPPPPTAMSIFAGMVLWIVNLVIKNVVISGGLVILAVIIFLYGRKRRRDRILYLL